MNVLFDDVISIRGIRIKQLAEQITCKHETTNIELKKKNQKVVQIMAQEIYNQGTKYFNFQYPLNLQKMKVSVIFHVNIEKLKTNLVVSSGK